MTKIHKTVHTVLYPVASVLVIIGVGSGTQNNIFTTNECRNWFTPLEWCNNVYVTKQMFLPPAYVVR